MPPEPTAPEPLHARWPRHVAVVMDGNGRWARQRYLPRLAGHRQGLEKLRELLRWCAELGVAELTVFAFSSENWARPEDEVSGLMRLMLKALDSEVQELERAGVRLRFPGDASALDAALQASLAQAERSTAHNHGLRLNVCFNYGGRWDVVQAAQKLAARAKPITEAALSAELAVANEPDLLIRTGGEQRLSNFLLWQAAYSELYFSAALWPAFERAEFERALHAFAARERRFGRTSEQLQPERALA